MCHQLLSFPDAEVYPPVLFFVFFFHYIIIILIYYTEGHFSAKLETRMKGTDWTKQQQKQETNDNVTKIDGQVLLLVMLMRLSCKKLSNWGCIVLARAEPSSNRSEELQIPPHTKKPSKVSWSFGITLFFPTLPMKLVKMNKHGSRKCYDWRESHELSWSWLMSTLPLDSDWVRAKKIEISYGHDGADQGVEKIDLTSSWCVHMHVWHDGSC